MDPRDSLRQGALAVERRGAEVARLSAGQIFGELALLGAGRRCLERESRLAALRG